MSYIDITDISGHTKRIVLERPLAQNDELVLARYLSDRLGVYRPTEKTPTHVNILALLAVLCERIETLEREC